MVPLVEYGPTEYTNIRVDLITKISQVNKSPETGADALLQYDNEYKLKALGTFNLPILQQTAKVCSNAVGK